MELVFSKDSTGTGEAITIGFYTYFESWSCSLIYFAMSMLIQADAETNIDLGKDSIRSAILNLNRELG